MHDDVYDLKAGPRHASTFASRTACDYIVKVCLALHFFNINHVLVNGDYQSVMMINQPTNYVFLWWSITHFIITIFSARKL